MRMPDHQPIEPPFAALEMLIHGYLLGLSPHLHPVKWCLAAYVLLNPLHKFALHLRIRDFPSRPRPPLAVSPPSADVVH